MTPQPPTICILSDGQRPDLEGLYRVYFRDHGYAVALHRSPTLEILLDQAMFSTPDLIVVMHVDSYALCAELRAEAHLVCCPIVVQGIDGQKDALLNAGAAAFFGIVVDMEEVHQAVIRLLAERVEGI
jgi:hypothetical protein